MTKGERADEEIRKKGMYGRGKGWRRNKKKADMKQREKKYREEGKDR